MAASSPRGRACASLFTLRSSRILTPSGVKIRHPAQHLLIHHALRHPPVGQVTARTEHARSDGVDALVSKADVMRGDDDVVELQQRIAGRRRLLLEYVDGCARDLVMREHLIERLLVDDRSAR